MMKRLWRVLSLVLSGCGSEELMTAGSGGHPAGALVRLEVRMHHDLPSLQLRSVSVDGVS